MCMVETTKVFHRFKLFIGTFTAYFVSINGKECLWRSKFCAHYGTEWYTNWWFVCRRHFKNLCRLVCNRKRGLFFCAWSLPFACTVGFPFKHGFSKFTLVFSDVHFLSDDDCKNNIYLGQSYRCSFSPLLSLFSYPNRSVERDQKRLCLELK